MPEELAVTLMVLLSALLHAGWNAMVKVGEERLLTFSLMLAVGAGISILALPWIAPPHREAWGFLLASVLIHFGYSTFLLLAYRVGDLGHAYPLARGSAPLLVAALSHRVAGEPLAAPEWGGVALISLGVVSLALGGRGPARRRWRPVAYSLGTGVFIAAYTLVDGLGVRRAGGPLPYIAWLFILQGTSMAAFSLVLKRGKALAFLKSQWRTCLAGGTMTMTAYGLVLWALALGAIAPVAALRETSVIIAALIGTLFLGEPFGKRRLAAAGLIATGIVALNLP